MARTLRKKLTARQREVLEVIQRSIEDNGYPPTIREIGAELGIKSTNAVNDHLKALQRKGYLERNEAKSRTLVPVGLSSPKGDTVDIPIMGRIAAGEPILAVENVEDTVRIDRFFIGPHHEIFGLRVVGQSMIGDGIFDGDFIFVRKQGHAAAGDIVVAWIEDEATVKRYYPEGDRIRFEPSNPAMKPIYVEASEFRETQILGIVVGIYRRLM